MKEAIIQDAFCLWLRKQGLCFIQARRDQRSTIKAGHPDFTVIHAGRVCLIETKTAKGKLSEDQKRVIAELLKGGTPTHICRSVEECVRVVTAWLGVGLSEPVKAPTVTASEQPEPFAKDFSEQFANLKVSISMTGKEFVGTWSGQPWVFRSRDDGRADLVRRATPDDIANLKSAA